MSSLAELNELVGFFSYSRRDDERAGGALSALRKRIHDELGLQLGRDLRLWQDTAAIPLGTLWSDEINRAIAESVFFIPIVTPAAVGSEHCRFEFDSFLSREKALGRQNLVFPLVYIRVPGLEDKQQREASSVLQIIGARQHVDWQKYRFHDLNSQEVAQQIEMFCSNIVDALRQPWISPEQRLQLENDARQKQELEAKERARIEEEQQERERFDTEAREQQRRIEGAARAENERKVRELREAKAREDQTRAEEAARAKAEKEHLEHERMKAQAQSEMQPREREQRESETRKKPQKVEENAKPEATAALRLGIGSDDSSATAPTSMRASQWHALWMCGVGVLFAGLDFQAPNYTGAQIRAEWAVGVADIGLLTTWSLVGLIVGSIVAGYVADRIGRKNGFIICMLITSLCTGSLALATSFATFSVLRVSASLGIGGLTPVVVAWLLEILPIRRRVALTAAVIGFLPLGWLVAQLLIVSLGSTSWRAVFLIGGFGVVIALVALAPSAAESPRWLSAKGRDDEARAILAKTQGINTTSDADARQGNWLTIFSPALIRTTILLTLIYVLLSALSSAVAAGAPHVFSAYGFNSQWFATYSFSTTGSAFIGTLILGLLLAWNRKTAFIIFWLGAAFSVALLSSASDPALIVLIGSALSFAGFSTLACLAIVAGESYPSGTRASGIGVVLAIGRLGGVLGPLIVSISYYYSTFGDLNTTFFVALALLPIACIGLWLPFKWSSE
jgi:MFS family permease